MARALKERKMTIFSAPSMYLEKKDFRKLGRISKSDDLWQLQPKTILESYNEKNAISKAQHGNKISPFTVQNKVKTWLGRCRPAAKTVVPKCNELESL